MTIRCGKYRTQAKIVRKRQNGWLLVKTANGLRIVHVSEVSKS